MCGATGTQQQIQQEQLDAYQQSQDMLKQEYGHQQAIYAPMAAKFLSIFNAGPSQEGFSEGEKQNLETQIVEGSGRNFANASRSLNEEIAAEGGTGMPSGAADEMKLGLSTSAAAEKTREETGVLEEDYATGRQNWQNAGAGLFNIAAGENPLGYEHASTEAGTAVSTTANDIAQQENSWINAALGAAGTAAEGWASGGFKHP